MAGDVAVDRVLPGLEVDLELVGLAAARLEPEVGNLPVVEDEVVEPAFALELGSKKKFPPLTVTVSCAGPLGSL